MKQSMTLQQLTSEVMRQARAREDYLFSTRELKVISTHPTRTVSTNTTTATQGAGSFEPAPLHSAEPSALRQATMQLSTPAGGFPLMPWAVEQIAGSVGMPLRYLRQLEVQNPNLLDLNINTLLLQNPKPRLVRTLDGYGRAFLSQRYRRLDNDGLIEALWTVLSDQGGFEVGSAELTPQRLFLKVVSPRLRGEVRVGDEVQAGLFISNSEIGCAAVSIEFLVYRLVCSNGAIVPVNVGRTRRTHAGGVLRLSSGRDYQLALDETQQARDCLAWDAVRETVREALHEEHFQEVLEQMRIAASLPIEADAQTVSERLATRYGLHKTEQQSIEAHLLESGDFSLWGLTNSITRTSQDVLAYERATELERLGGTLLHLSPREWKGLSLN